MRVATIEQRDVVKKSGVSETLMSDTFSDRRPVGKVIGRSSPQGVLRKGIDVEGVLSIDNDALRIQPLVHPGWERAGIAYGPYVRKNGLALGIFLLNGHNTARSENYRDTFRNRLDRWLRGSETHLRRVRLFQWLRSKRKMRFLRQVRCWFYSSRDSAPVPKVDENLALGWFSSEVPANPLVDGNAFVMHAAGPDNGELWSSVASNGMASIRGLQNLQIYYVIILREKGAAYYAGSITDAHGLSAYPYVRPLAIDPFEDNSTVYAALHQSVLGEIGFRLDTRLYGIQVSKLEEFSTWYGSAHAADQLKGTGLLGRSEAETGGCWCVYDGEYDRTDFGARPSGTKNLAILDPGKPSGLVHMIIETDGDAPVDVVWRFLDEDNYWSLTVSGSGCRLSLVENGTPFVVSSSDKWKLTAGNSQSVQVLDDGKSIGLYLQGQLLFDSWFTDNRLQDATGVGFRTEGSDTGLYISKFEAQPRQVKLPEVLDLGEPWLRKGTRVTLADDFQGPAQDLAGRVTNVGDKIWSRTIGTGFIDVTGAGSAKIRASAQNPSPNRTAYTVDWDHPDFADVEVAITPPGNDRGQKEHGLSGFIFWQDEDNYFTINIWVSDGYGGASISTFFQIDGFEDLYDAIWSNVGKRIYWGVSARFRVVFDGMNYIAFVDDEPVLYRALTDVYPDCRKLSINRVGLIANWEWGMDTGSVFNNLVGRI